MEFVSIHYKAQEWNMSKRRIQILCKEGRVAGAKMIGNMWTIPKDTEKPIDARKKKSVNSSQTVTFSKIRRELKNILKELYAQVQQDGIEEKYAKKYVLSVLAVSLLKKYSRIHDEAQIFNMVYSDLSWEDDIPPYMKNIQSSADCFVHAFQDDKEIDDILSWAYQYFNKIGEKGTYTNTQFFTERYMTKYLIDKIGLKNTNVKIVDPCCGGGNFLVECLENISKDAAITEKYIVETSKLLHGFDIDKDIAKVAIINIKIRCISILAKNGHKNSLVIWKDLAPNIYCNIDHNVGGALSDFNTMIRNASTGERVTIYEGLCNADYILTNPPYETVRGMDDTLKMFLKEHYPESNCDTCVAFFYAIFHMLKENGTCGIVSQTAWLHLKSFANTRKAILNKYAIKYIADLGSGAFYDISGEKSNVALFIMDKDKKDNNVVEITNLTELSIVKKAETLSGHLEAYQKLLQTKMQTGFDYKSSEGLKIITQKNEVVENIAVPMQGTSTGNAKELVGYFWEHFDDPDWILVSNGGGYCRWQGLNDSVVKWGKEGEYIKQQKGSAIRNAKYFSVTDFVYSDTGTAGLNVRIKLDKQIFIASGPGIRINQGNAMAQLAYFNSRLATYYIRTTSPKLTIAAGYIAKLPICKEIYTSVVLAKNAELCVELKQTFLSKRPCNYEYTDKYLEEIKGNIYEAAYALFISEMESELIKLELEAHIDQYILSVFGLLEEDQKILEEQVGVCAFHIHQTSDLEAEHLDKYLSGLIDDACSLKKTKVSKNGMGCDGLLEYAAKDLTMNPEYLIQNLQLHKDSLKFVLDKYVNLLLHNEVLRVFEYHTKTGVKRREIECLDMCKHLSEKYEIPFSIEEWLSKHFNRVHTNVFKGVPMIQYRDSKIEVIIHG